jgi:hypothetical protein
MTDFVFVKWPRRAYCAPKIPSFCLPLTAAEVIESYKTGIC